MLTLLYWKQLPYSKTVDCKSLRLFWNFILSCLLYIHINNNKFTYDKFKTTKFAFSKFDMFSQVLFKQVAALACVARGLRTLRVRFIRLWASYLRCIIFYYSIILIYIVDGAIDNKNVWGNRIGINFGSQWLNGM